MSTDAIVVLKDEHQVIRKLFSDFQAAGLSRAQLQDIGARMVEARKTAPEAPPSPAP